MSTTMIKKLAKALRERANEHYNEAEGYLKRGKARGLKLVERNRLDCLAHGFAMRGRECLVIAEGLENGWPPKRAANKK